MWSAVPTVAPALRLELWLLHVNGRWKIVHLTNGAAPRALRPT
jgi:hypothetical protein